MLPTGQRYRRHQPFGYNVAGSPPFLQENGGQSSILHKGCRRNNEPDDELLNEQACALVLSLEAMSHLPAGNVEIPLHIAKKMKFETVDCLK
jgi:hypothetical protein